MDQNLIQSLFQIIIATVATVVGAFAVALIQKFREKIGLTANESYYWAVDQEITGAVESIAQTFVENVYVPGEGLSKENAQKALSLAMEDAKMRLLGLVTVTDNPIAKLILEDAQLLASNIEAKITMIKKFRPTKLLPEDKE